jgi:hypothetical protein
LGSWKQNVTMIQVRLKKRNSSVCQGCTDYCNFISQEFLWQSTNGPIGWSVPWQTCPVWPKIAMRKCTGPSHLCTLDSFHTHQHVYDKASIDKSTLLSVLISLTVLDIAWCENSCLIRCVCEEWLLGDFAQPPYLLQITVLWRINKAAPGDNNLKTKTET